MVTDKSSSSSAASGRSVNLTKDNLHRYRGFLRMIAGAEISYPLRPKVDPSDIVQQTLLEACQNYRQFRGTSEPELAQWLRQMIVNNISDAVRALRRQKRDMNRERPLFPNNAGSTGVTGCWLISEHTSPSQRAVKAEELFRMSEAIATLPKDQQDAIVLHHLQGCSLMELADHFGRSQAAVAGLLHRALKTLRAKLAAST